MIPAGVTSGMYRSPLLCIRIFSVYNNISYPLDLIKFPKPRIDGAVKQIAEQLKIDHLLGKYPDQLSGGEKQRVALARGVVKHTDIYILDDPLGGLRL